MATVVKPFVVGVDGSDSALDAVAWAAREAELHGEPLRLVHAFVWPRLRIPPVFAHMGPPDGLRAYADQILDRALQTARAAANGVNVSVHLEPQFPIPVLVEESRLASYIALGVRSRGAFGDALAGSTVIGLTCYGHAPVAVIHGTPSPDRLSGPVVVGIDGSPLGAAAAEIAYDYASRHGAPLLAVHVGHDVETAEQLISESLAGWREKYPDVELEERIVDGHPGGVLVELSRDARLTVVGARGRGGFTGMLLGSVSQALVHHAHSPVVVVPHGSL